MKEILKKSSSKFLYKQVADHIKIQIRKGKWSKKIPSQRILADDLGVNRSTVIKAIEELKREGLLETKHHQKGIFIKREVWSVLSLEESDWGKNLPNKAYVFNGALEQLLINGRKHKGIIDLGDEELGIDLLSPSLMKKALDKSMSSLENLEDSENLNLKKALAKKLKESGIKARDENILIITSSTQGIYLILLSLLPRFSQILTEDLSRIFQVKLSRATQMILKGIRVEEDGLDLNQLIESLNPNKTNLIYLNPSILNPTGRMMSLEKRKKLIDISKKYKVPIVEEDYSRFLLKDEDSPKTLKEIGGDNVIYISNFHRIFSPKFSLAYIVANKEIIKRLGEVKKNMGLDTSYFTQEVLANWLEAPEYEEVQRRKNSEIERRRELVVNLLKKYLPEEIRWELCDGGYYVWIDLSHFRDEVHTLKMMIDNGVLLYPRSLFGERGRGYYRLCFCRESDETLERGIILLRDTIKNMKIR